MSKAKKTEAPQRRTKLDRIVTQLRAILRRETTSVIEAGKLLIESRDHLEHGEWRSWLVNNFDLSYQTALNYCAAAKYVEQKSNVGHFDFANLSARVLYALADGRYNEQEEAAILIATHEGRVDATRVHAIQQTLNPVADDDTEDAADQEDSSTEEDAEIAAILDGPPPAVPPPAPSTTPNFALRDFDQAISVLKQLMTKSSAQFVSSIHSREDLENVESFIRAVADRAREALWERAS